MSDSQKLAHLGSGADKYDVTVANESDFAVTCGAGCEHDFLQVVTGRGRMGGNRHSKAPREARSAGDSVNALVADHLDCVASVVVDDGDYLFCAIDGSDIELDDLVSVGIVKRKLICFAFVFKNGC